MTLKERINVDFLAALKSKNVVAKTILSVVKGEIQNIEKNVGSDNLSDEEVTKILKRTSKSLNETISLLNKSGISAHNLKRSQEELDIIMSYLPKQMTKEEVYVKVTELVNSGITQIGAIMKEFATLPVDKKMVSETIKEIVK